MVNRQSPLSNWFWKIQLQYRLPFEHRLTHNLHQSFQFFVGVDLSKHVVKRQLSRLRLWAQFWQGIKTATRYQLWRQQERKKQMYKGVRRSLLWREIIQLQIPGSIDGFKVEWFETLPLRHTRWKQRLRGPEARVKSLQVNVTGSWSSIDSDVSVGGFVICI